MELTTYGFATKEIGEYTYNYRYGETTVSHHLMEYYEEEKGTRVIILEKETRKGDNFVRLPQSLWITREGYPPFLPTVHFSRLENISQPSTLPGCQPFRVQSTSGFSTLPCVRN